MIFMGDLWEELDKFAEYYVNVCIIGGVIGIVVPLDVQSININCLKLRPTRI